MKHPCQYCQTMCGGGVWPSTYHGHEIMTIKCEHCNVGYDMDWTDKKMMWIGFHFFQAVNEDAGHKYAINMNFRNGKTSMFHLPNMTQILTLDKIFPDTTPRSVDKLINRLKNLLVFS
jgi:hypothetical protein